MKINLSKHLLGSGEIFEIKKVKEKVPLIITIFASGGWEVKPARKISKAVKTILLIFGNYCANTSKDQIHLTLNPKKIRVIFTGRVFDKGCQEVRYNPETSTLFFLNQKSMIRLLEKWGLPITLFDKYVWEKILTILRCFISKVIATINTKTEAETEKVIRLSKFGFQAPCG